MIKIAFSGTHGTGKTTSVFEKVVELKKENPTKDVGVLSEVSRSCPFPINLDGGRKSQMWIFMKQLEREWEMEQSGRYGILVCDRTVVDSIAYTSYKGYDGLVQEMLKIVRETGIQYDTIYFKRLINNPYLYPDGTRETTDQEYRGIVEVLMRGLYRTLEWEVVEI